MNNKYRLDHGSQKLRKRPILIVITISLIIMAILAITIIVLIISTKTKTLNISGPAESVAQSGNPAVITQAINEQNYIFDLPSDWHQIKVVTYGGQNSVTWQSFQKDATNRYLTIYSDPIPATFAVNRELPIESHGTSLSHGDISDNCANFTNSGSPKSVVPTLAKWQNVNFYCNSPNFADNQVGTGTVEAVNSITLTGSNSGAHHYFFLYIDRNTAPDYSIFYSILNSFRAK